MEVTSGIRNSEYFLKSHVGNTSRIQDLFDDFVINFWISFSVAGGKLKSIWFSIELVPSNGISNLIDSLDELILSRIEEILVTKKSANLLVRSSSVLCNGKSDKIRNRP